MANVTSPVGVAGAQIVIEVPAGIVVGAATETGFMTGASSLSSGTEYRWFQLTANGQTNGGLVVPITLPQGSYTVTLANVGLKDSNGNSITIDTRLPINIQIGQPISSSSSSTTSSSNSQVVIGQTQTTTPIPEFMNAKVSLMAFSFILALIITTAQAKKHPNSGTGFALCGNLWLRGAKTQQEVKGGKGRNSSENIREKR
jgi:hypothetical protein